MVMKSATSAAELSDTIIMSGRLMRLAHKMTWALAGRGSLDDVVDDIAQVCGAQSASLMRFDIALERLDQVTTIDVQRADLDINAARDVCSAPAGTILDVDVARQIKTVIVLESNERLCDMLVLVRADSTWSSVIAQELALIWARRSKGQIAGVLGARFGTDQSGAILSPKNPYSLTPKETQVCYRLADGLKPKDIAEQLGCSMPTVRTHLRNIYAKTELDGMIPVVHRLHEDAQTL